MNILLIGKLYPDTFSQHIYDTLISMNHSVRVFKPGLENIYTNSKLVKGVLVLREALYNIVNQLAAVKKVEELNFKNLLTSEKFDLTISVHDFLTSDEVELIKKITKTPVVLWYPDALSNFSKSMFISANYDYLFFKDPYVVDYFNKILLKKVYYLPECCNPSVHKPVHLTEKDKNYYGCDITTAGNLYTNRVAFFSNLNEYNVKIWGNPAPAWMNISGIKNMIMNKYVSGVEKSKAFSAAKIVLNNLHPAEIRGVNCRAFEIPACGGFQIINYRSGLNQLFTLDKEVVAFDNYNDLIEKLNYYLDHEKERKTIAIAGMERAHREHTYRKRLELLLDTVFKNAIGDDINI